MTDISFSFPPQASGFGVVVKNAANQAVHSATLETSADIVTLTVDLPWAPYVAEARNGNWSKFYSVQGTQVEDAPGAAETAYLIAEGPAMATDAAADDITFEADPTHGELPSWATIVAGEIVLGAEAGICAWSLEGFFDCDFTEASEVPDAGGTIEVNFSVTRDDAEVDTATATGPGDGENAQTSVAGRAGTAEGGTYLAPGTIACAASCGASDDQPVNIPDGVATPRVGLTITRIALLAYAPEPT